jgi:hypothetical protein
MIILIEKGNQSFGPKGKTHGIPHARSDHSFLYAK